MALIEAPSRIEPCLFEGDLPSALADLSVDLQRESAELGKGLHPDSLLELADLVRVMNCYYSNLIEGHNTRPRDIEAALKGAELAPERRALALEARAHVEVQREIDRRHTTGELTQPTTIAFIRWLHASFYDAMPGEFRRVEMPGAGTIEIEPGEFRSRPEHEVAVGRHQPPSSYRVADFMGYFERRFGAAEKQSAQRILSIATAHHRFNFIHPFIDGNGRVSRLMSHAMGLRAGIGGGGLWSVSRGLARGLKERGEYKQMMDHADSPRQGDLDGRGNLSQAALTDFTKWFLEVCLDQVRFSSTMFDLERLEERYRALVQDMHGDRRAANLISAVIRYGSLQRGAAALVVKTSERTARSILGELADLGFLKSNSPKTPVRIAFPLDYRERLFPNLFSDAEIADRPPR
ncbi:hypothetical protein FP2506_00450 [Fulvimarina pelagi HTCC2506]|uniref:Fido domain-containing protein n=1 Tax=Fulvimarina pelagi HTCC2506 TaxID=314231 RepID=Q0FXP5_9HYPH|nr:Fic family protein [Fulvimarina pelagi]EAU39838.1 hypothetical protein FP2506_00450 [Fulvimarina pelagi HTCC2506]